MIFNPLITLLVGCIATSAAAALDPIVIKGTKFFNSKTGEQFFIKGLAYQPGGASSTQDPLGNINICKRDIKNFKELGINTLRVYQVDLKNNHANCMKLFEDNGIYLLLDLPNSGLSIDRNNPLYDMELYDLFRKKIDRFSKYNNVLAFIGGNEVSNHVGTVEASVYVKASIRDAKAHMKSKGTRYIPIGYADNDDPAIQKNIMHYFNCGKEEERADFYGINIYRWEGHSTYEQSGYKRFVDENKDYSLPIFFSEFGARFKGGRPFTEIGAIFGPQMTGFLSGGVAYEYTEEPNNFGLVKVVSDSKVEKFVDFDNLAKQYNQVKPVGVKMADYKPHNLKPSECPKVEGNWVANAKLPPAPSVTRCECALKKLSCVATEESQNRGGDVGNMMGELCKKGYCNLVSSHAKTGKHSPFSTCSKLVKQSLIYNTAFKKEGQCSFGGLAKAASPSGGELSECGDLSDIPTGNSGSEPEPEGAEIPEIIKPDEESDKANNDDKSKTKSEIKPKSEASNDPKGDKPSSASSINGVHSSIAQLSLLMGLLYMSS